MRTNKFCVYFHINPIKKEIFYVGIGNSKRPYSKRDRSSWWKRVIEKYNYDIVIIHNNLSWKEVCVLEKLYIKQIGRRDLGYGPLVNMTFGGDGGITRINFKQSQVTKNKISKANKGHICSEEQKRKLSLAHKGKKLSEEHKRKLKNAAKKGIPRTEEVKQKISAANKGKLVSKKTRQKIAATLKGSKQSEETKLKRIKSLRGRKISEETRERLKLAWIIRKQKIICV